MRHAIRIVSKTGLGVGVEVYDTETGAKIEAAWSKAVIIIEAGAIIEADITFEGVELDVVAEADIPEGGDDARNT